jgi:hypothetical protein
MKKKQRENVSREAIPTDCQIVDEDADGETRLAIETVTS